MPALARPEPARPLGAPFAGVTLREIREAQEWAQAGRAAERPEKGSARPEAKLWKDGGRG